MSALPERSPRPDAAGHTVLRDMEQADLSAVLEVEGASFPSPWTRAMFEEELRHPLSWRRVIDRSGVGVVGFLLSRFYGDVWHVMDLAVTPEHRGCGYAGRLLDEFLSFVPPDLPVVLEVREGNEAAIRLYESRGFRHSGRRDGYYQDGADAALLMVHGPEVGW